jgi:hypothetical protein
VQYLNLRLGAKGTRYGVASSVQPDFYAQVRACSDRCRAGRPWTAVGHQFHQNRAVGVRAAVADHLARVGAVLR